MKEREKWLLICSLISTCVFLSTHISSALYYTHIHTKKCKKQKKTDTGWWIEKSYSDSWPLRYGIWIPEFRFSRLPVCPRQWEWSGCTLSSGLALRLRRGIWVEDANFTFMSKGAAGCGVGWGPLGQAEKEVMGWGGRLGIDVGSKTEKKAVMSEGERGKRESVLGISKGLARWSEAEERAFGNDWSLATTVNKALVVNWWHWQPGCGGWINHSLKEPFYEMTACKALDRLSVVSCHWYFKFLGLNLMAKEMSHI